MKPEPTRIDPLKRVFVPIERDGQFRTHDGRPYRRLLDGSIRRAIPKVRGKAARKADKLARRAAFAAMQDKA